MANDNAITAEEIKQNFERVQDRIGKAAQIGGRSIEDVRLVVVTKAHSFDVVQMTIETGARYLGENYVEEGIEKKSMLGERADIEWHMIGHIQSRKAQAVCEYYDCVHSLDSLKLAKRLSRFTGEFNRELPVLLECNVSGEQTKFGFSASQESHWSELLLEISQIAELPNLQLCGLMTMAPYFDDPEKARPVFRKLKSFQQYLSGKIPQHSWKELSMGMSADYEVAIQEGATIVRVGTAIVGSRYYC